MPLSTYTRGARSQTITGQEFFGYCSSKGSKYCGGKLFLTATTQQVVDKWLLVPAAHHDRDALGAVLEDECDLTLLAEGAFHKPVLDELCARRQVTVAAPPRRDRRQPWSAELRALVGKLRRRVETTLRGRETVFAIEHPKARSTDGVFARVATQLLAYTLCFITQPLLEALGG